MTDSQEQRFQSATAQRFDRLEGRFDHLEGRFDRLEGRFGHLEERFDQLEGRLDQLEGRFGHLEERFDNLEGRFGHLEGRFDQLEGRFDQLEGRFDQLEGRFDQLEGRFDQLEGRFDRVIDDLGPLKGAHAGNAAGKEAALIARDLGLGYRKSLTIIELLNLTDAADTTDVAVNELRSFHRADLIVEVTDSDGEVCYVAAEASYTVNGRDTERAIRNAGLLTKLTGRRSHAVVAGCRRDDRIRDRVESGEVYWYQLALEAMQAE